MRNRASGPVVGVGGAVRHVVSLDSAAVQYAVVPYWAVALSIVKTCRRPGAHLRAQRGDRRTGAHPEVLPARGPPDAGPAHVPHPRRVRRGARRAACGWCAPSSSRAAWPSPACGRSSPRWPPRHPRATTCRRGGLRHAHTGAPTTRSTRMPSHSSRTSAGTSHPTPRPCGRCPRPCARRRPPGCGLPRRVLRRYAEAMQGVADVDLSVAERADHAPRRRCAPWSSAR